MVFLSISFQWIFIDFYSYCTCIQNVSESMGQWTEEKKTEFSTVLRHNTTCLKTGVYKHCKVHEQVKNTVTVVIL